MPTKYQEPPSSEPDNVKYPDRIVLSDIPDGASLSCGGSATDRIHASVEHPGASTRLFVYRFQLGTPRRFDTVFDIPSDAVNACVTLNGLLVTGLCAGTMPEDAVLPDCLDPAKTKQEMHGHETSSTIVPGKPQVISFRWFDADELRFYLYFAQ